MNTERHNWSESDEKSLMATVKWVEENIPPKVMKGRGKWNIVSGLLFTDIGLRVSDNACRKRYADIKSRQKERDDNGRHVVELLGVDFPQAQDNVENKEIIELKNRVLALELQVNNLVISLKELTVTNPGAYFYKPGY